MKVYVVTSGEYSDYHINAVFSTREQAKRYCANRNKVGERFWRETYNIETYEIDPSFTDANKKVVYAYEIPVHRAYAGLISDTDRYWITCYNMNEIIFYEGDVTTHVERDKESGIPRMLCIVVGGRPNRKKAEKIANDMIAELNAEEQGII